MGVKGLQGFIENKSEILKPLRFRESKLVIDGSSLYYMIYLRSHLDQAHGGDYIGFESLIKHFFKILKACEIEPYVVLDGGDDVRGKKFQTLKRRCQQKIRRANILARSRSSGEAIPILTKDVFKQIMRKLEVPFIQCLAEADLEAAALANEWNCPVLSNDSDFYVFGNKGGFLPLSQFTWAKVNLRKCASKPHIPAKLFDFQNLSAAYNHINESLVHLFATILGNDYVKLDKGMLGIWARSKKAKKAGKIDGLLMWLSRFSDVEEAINELLSPLESSTESDHLRNVIYQGLEMYTLNNSSIVQFFTSGKPQIRPPGPLQNLPDWSLVPLAEGRLHSTMIEVLMLQRVLLHFQVENCECSSSSRMSELIRQATYGILLCSRRREDGGCGTTGKEKLQYEVEEYDRQETILTSFMVPALLPRCAGTHLELETLWETPQDLRLQVLFEALHVTSGPDSLLIPENLQLAIYVTCFWLKHAEPELKAEMFWALLIGLVFGELSRAHQSNEEVQRVIQRLKKLRARKGKRMLDVELAHAYCQWQNCMRDSNSLNQLLNNPVPEPELTWLYGGSLVHGAAHEFMRGVRAEALLLGNPFAISLYRKLQAAVESELDDDLMIRMRTRAGPTRFLANQALVNELMVVKGEEEVGRNPSDEGSVMSKETCSAQTGKKKKRKPRAQNAKKVQ
ncbi:protein asteroid homolog 1 [Trichomycterus rosablanca]|uniref:protein asteroid homolog 1 n=1 Tax=Trichomycterus rosablanca TaxID=2290929 RepID=UPI002F356752